MKISIESDSKFNVQGISFDGTLLRLTLTTDGCDAGQRHTYSLDLGEGPSQPRQMSTVVEYLRRYVASAGLKPQTEETYRHVERYLEKYGDRPLDEITTEYLRGFIVMMEQQSLSGGTVYLYFSKLVCVLRDAYKNELFDERILLRVRRPKRAQQKKVFLTEQELGKLARVAVPESKRNMRDMFLFSCFSGLRFSDVVGLRHSDIDKRNGKMTLHFRQTKTATDETVPLSEQARRIVLSQERDGKHVFRPERGPSVNAFLKEWCKKARIRKKVTFHTARHTFCVLLLSKEVPIYTVQKLMCHSDIRTTNIYADILNKTKTKAVKKIPIIECVRM